MTGSKTLTDGRKVLIGSKADPESKKYLKASGGKSVVLADGTQLNAEQSKNYGKTPTVISNDNIISNVIPELEAKADKVTGNSLIPLPQKEEQEDDFSQFDLSGSTKKQSDPYVDQQMQLLDRYSKSLDRNDRDRIEGIKSTFAGLSADQRAINEANTAGVRGALMSGGGAVGGQFRYSPLGAFGGVANEATAGVRALTGLMQQENQLISEVQSARQEKDYKLLEQKLGILEGVRKERQAATAAAEQAVQSSQRKSQVESAVIGEINKGNINPMAIFQALGGEVGFDEITAITKDMPKQDPFTLGSSDIRFDAQGNVIAKGSKVGSQAGDVYAGDALSVGNPVVIVGSPTIQGLGTSYKNSTVEAQLVIDDIVNGLPTQLINNVAEIPRWQESVRKQLAAGYAPQQIIDKLSGFRIFDETKKPLGDVFYNLAIGTDLQPQVISDLINRGANEQAMTTVENAQLKNANAFFASTDQARNAVKQTDTVLSLLDKVPKDKLGPFDGKVFQLQKKNFLTSKLTPEEKTNVIALEQALDLLAAPLRVAIAGTAATPEEMAKITSFQSSILSQPDVIKAQVESLRDGILGFHNEARAQRGLPTVDKQQVIDNKKRLELYKGLGKQNSAIQYNELSNEDLLRSISGTPYQPVGSQSSSDFWSSLTPTQ